MGGGRGRLAGSGGDRGELNSSIRDSSLVIVVRAVDIASAEMYPESGIFQRVSVTRPLADKRSLVIDGNGMLLNESSRRCGADPPKNESGRTDATLGFAQTSRCVSSGNGFCIAAANLSQHPMIFISVM